MSLNYWSRAMFPLSYADARTRSNRNAPANTELLPRSWNFAIFVVNILIMHITKKLLKCRAVVRSCKNFLLRTVAGLRSCKKLEGTLVKTCHVITGRVPYAVFYYVCSGLNFPLVEGRQYKIAMLFNISSLAYHSREQTFTRTTRY